MWLRSIGKDGIYDSFKFVPVPGTQVWFQVPSINCHQNSCRLLPGFSRALTSQHHWDPAHRFWHQGTFQGWCSSAILFPWVLPVKRFTLYWPCWDWTGEVKHSICEKMSSRNASYEVSNYNNLILAFKITSLHMNNVPSIFPFGNCVISNSDWT